MTYIAIAGVVFLGLVAIFLNYGGDDFDQQEKDLHVRFLDKRNKGKIQK